MDFAHLHVHTIYSFLDGYIHPEALARECVVKNIAACAVTDHGHIGGVLRAYKQLKDHGIKPIPGLEAWVGKSHLVLLALDGDGYANLMALATAHARGPLAITDLAAHARGLYALTACALGAVPAALLANDRDRARAVLRRLVDVFGRDNVGVELQFHGPMAALCPWLCQLAEDEGLVTVATNDVHYLNATDAEAQNLLMAIRQGRRLGDPELFQHRQPEYWLKSLPQMLAAPQTTAFTKSIEQTMVIAERCHLDLKLGKPDLPSFDADERGLLAREAERGFGFRGLPADYRPRLDHELQVIGDMGYAGYYLIVSDFVAWARGHEVAVGPGRGSGAGSLVAYCLGITDLDPVAHGLFFERFLNAERVSMPDFDVDFSQAGRQRVIDYVVGKYGRDHVGQIATYMGLGAKTAIKDVARVLDIPFAEVNELTKVIPSTIRPKTAGEEAMHAFDLAMTYAPDLEARGVEDPVYARLLDMARNLTGCLRQTGTHAGGVVIGRRPIAEYTPLTADGLTAYDMKDVEAAGLVKFDFLGVKTLDVIDAASREANVDVRRLPLDDADVYRQMGDERRTWGVFQIESPGMSGLCRRLAPTRFEEIVAAVALYRPGPKESGMLDDFVERRHGRQDVVYPHPLVEECLRETYGTIVYQEQVMAVARAVAGYTLGGADILRRAMGKKVLKEMHEQRQKFVAGCAGNDIGEGQANELFDVIEKFAGYGFNKAHAAGYALISYQTAWLKYHHLLPFTAALLTIEDREARARYVREARGAGVGFLPPDVNDSDIGFRVEDGRVRWGLAAVKGLGDAHLSALVAHRPYVDFFDVARRSTLGAAALKTLVACGACDRFGERGALTAACDHVSADRRQAALEAGGQMAMGLGAEVVMADGISWTRVQRLGAELKTLGAYVTGHPCTDVEGVTPDNFVRGHRRVTGIVADVFERRARVSSRLWAKLTIEGVKSHMVLTIFPDAYEAWGRDLVVGRLVTVVGRPDDDDLLVVDEIRVHDL